MTSSESDHLAVSEGDVDRLRKCLAGDGVAVIPTDTVYGLACNPLREAAVQRVYELKRRPPRKPAAIMFFALGSALEMLPELGSSTRAALEALLPGPITVLLANPEARYPLVCAPDGSDPSVALLGLRVPALPGSLAPLRTIPVPIAQSSANLSGGSDPRAVAEVPGELRVGAEVVIDAGTLPGTASTVLDLSGYERDRTWTIVRAGPVDSSRIEAALN